MTCMIYFKNINLAASSHYCNELPSMHITTGIVEEMEESSGEHSVNHSILANNYQHHHILECVYIP